MKQLASSLKHLSDFVLSVSSDSYLHKITTYNPDHHHLILVKGDLHSDRISANVFRMLCKVDLLAPSLLTSENNVHTNFVSRTATVSETLT